MHNDLSWPVVGPLNPATKRVVYGVLDTVARSHELTAKHLERLESSYQATSDAIAASPELGDDVTEIHAQGSRALGTSVRPIGKHGFDIDSISHLRAGARAKYSGDGGAERLLQAHFTVLKRHGDRHGLKVRRKTRCIQIEYTAELHADITPFFEDPCPGLRWGEHHGVVPDRELRSYCASNPVGYRKWFDTAAAIRPNLAMRVIVAKSLAAEGVDVVPLPAADEVFPRFLCRLVQVAKIHRNTLFANAPELAPTSIFITTLIATAYSNLALVQHGDELDLMLNIVKAMASSFQRRWLPDGQEEWVLLNPTTHNENVASRMNTPERQSAFRQWLAKFFEDLFLLASSAARAEGGDQRLVLVESAFGAQAARHLRTETMALVQARRASSWAAAAVPTGQGLVLPSRSHTFHGSQS
ncbi:nucleotidyltransferase [Ramlibacter sp.]|uniref:nucleotidyltransferase domain-containing protein n=1 Tax=Ramlibacter sp. TaxID=1917967 RepID=UPI002D4E8294|nr:nucleotidyltransferase [Ramlibacter sp.]HYD75304.1 nucleotidyltransferase [Ramlibacter sp.]